MEYRIELSAQAAWDAEEVVARIALQYPRRADRWLAGLLKSIESLKVLPRALFVGPGIRRLSGRNPPAILRKTPQSVSHPLHCAGRHRTRAACLAWCKTFSGTRRFVSSYFDRAGFRHTLGKTLYSCYDVGKERVMIELTDEQRHQLEIGKAVDFTDPRTARSYVVLRKDIYDRVQRLVCDDSEWTDDELRLQLARSSKENGWDEPGMDAYDRYDQENGKQ
jgi:hypothetical protein